MEVFAMGSIRLRPDNGNLFFDFHYLGKRCREQTSLKDTRANRKLTEAALEKIEADIVSSNFEYAKYFPNSKMVEKFNGGPITSLIEKKSTVTHPLMQNQPLSSPIFETFANT